MITKKVYLAGPISGLTFQEANGWREELTEALAKYGIEAFNPIAPEKEFDDGRVIEHSDAPSGISSKEIFERDIAWIEESNLVLAYFNALHFSPGTMWELGYAHALGKKIVVFGNPSQINHPFVDCCAYSIPDASAVYLAAHINHLLDRLK